MVAPALIAGGLQAAGSLLGGRQRRKDAKRQLALVQRLSDEAVQAAQREQVQLLGLRDQDQAEMERLTAYDESKLRAASGYDLIKLRDQAKAAGFNPLTVLQATGGAGYDGRAGVLTTPFISRVSAFDPTSDDYWQRAANSAGSGQAVVQSAGYVGDAISAGGSAYFAQRNQDAQVQLERERIAALRQPVLTAAKSVSNGSPFSDAPVRKLDAAYTVPYGPQPPVRVYTPQGWVNLDPGAAARIGVTNGDTLIGQDYEQLFGEVGGEVLSGLDFGIGQPVIRRDDSKWLQPSPKYPPATPNQQDYLNW